MVRPLEVLSAVCCLLSCVACSIKESREACPCRLLLDFSENDTVSVKSVELQLNASGGFHLADTLSFENFDELYQALVPSGDVNVQAWCGGEGCISPDGGLTIPLGNDCPEVYMCFFNIVAEGEQVQRGVCLKKNHCRATLYVKTENDFPYRLVVKGDVDGYGADGQPVEGMFEYEMALQEDRVGWVTLPRQRNDSLMLEVWEGEELLKVFTLGRYISAVGYDWQAEHLEDLTLSLDYTHNVIGISMGKWDKEHHFDVSI